MAVPQTAVLHVLIVVKVFDLRFHLFYLCLVARGYDYCVACFPATNLSQGEPGTPLCYCHY